MTALLSVLSMSWYCQVQTWISIRAWGSLCPGVCANVAVPIGQHDCREVLNVCWLDPGPTLRPTLVHLANDQPIYNESGVSDIGLNAAMEYKIHLYQMGTFCRYYRESGVPCVQSPALWSECPQFDPRPKHQWKMEEAKDPLQVIATLIGLYSNIWEKSETIHKSLCVKQMQNINIGDNVVTEPNPVNVSHMACSNACRYVQGFSPTDSCPPHHMYHSRPARSEDSYHYPWW